MIFASIEDNTLVRLYEDDFASIFTVDHHPHSVVVSARREYIPKRDFKNLFEYVGNIALERNVQKVVFDKSSLRVFDQTSMIWYFTVWKEKMYDHGVVNHRKILPDDMVFRESAIIARSKLYLTYPDAKFHLMDIRYCQSISEALTI